MHFRGQSGLDLLLGLIVLLIVLNVFASVLTRFEEVQKEISLRGQLRENLSQIRWLTEYATSQYRDVYEYPATATLAVGGVLPVWLVDYTYSTGSTILEPVRSTGTRPDIPCYVDWDTNYPNINYHAQIRTADSSLPYDVDANVLAIFHLFYDLNHTFAVTGCFDSFVIGVKP